MAFPAIRVRLLLADRNSHLIDDGIDLAVRVGELADSTMVATRIGAMRTVTCASPVLLAQVGTPKTPAELQERPAIMAEMPMPGAGWRFRGTEPRDLVEIPVLPRLIVTSTAAAAAAAIRGVGFVQLLFYQAADAVTAGQLRIVLENFELPPAPVHLVHAARGQLPLKMRCFLDFAAPRLRRALETIAQAPLA